MTAVPFPTATTFPSFTVATLVLLDFQVTFLLLAFDGETVATKFVNSPFFKLKLVLSKVTPVTEIESEELFTTVTLQVTL